MKKVILILIILLTTFLIICTGLLIKISKDNFEISKKNDFNSFFEKYNDKTLYGADIYTILNRIEDINEENKYISENREDVDAEITFIYTDEKEKIIEKKCKLKDLQKVGLKDFITNFSLTKFKCENLEYNNQQMVNKVIVKQLEV